MESIEFTSRSASETWNIGEHIGRHAARGDCFALCGDLGAGKTQLVKGIARGLGVSDWLYVVSPSFTLMNVYEGTCTLCHVDLYRLGEMEADDLDMEAYLESGIVVVEWAERSAWPDGTIRVYIETIADEDRIIRLEVQDVGRAEIWRDFRKGRGADPECGTEGNRV